ncbi:unnamed protein product, partial [Mesorhabditis belari]|uniref:Secreted protein n=1 Tax=Mesorhabditis belari TaxID=2138241 RepID=A0AAF3F3A2_9BILA
MFVKTCVALILIGIGLSNEASIEPRVCHFQDLIKPGKEAGSTSALLTRMCRNFHHFKKDNARFSKARRRVFAEAEFRLCDVEKRPIAEQTLECIFDMLENAPQPTPECEPVTNLDLTIACSDETMELLSNCTFKPVIEKCTRPHENATMTDVADRMMNVIYYFETQLLVTPFANDTCGWKFTQRVEASRKWANVMTDLAMSEPIKK